MSMITQLILVVAVAMLLLLVEHYLPWRAILKRELGAITRYVMGMMAIQVPLSILLVEWSEWMVLIALWIITVAGGLVVLLAYALDTYLETRARMQISEHEAKVLRPEVRNGSDE